MKIESMKRVFIVCDCLGVDVRCIKVRVYSYVAIMGTEYVGKRKQTELFFDLSYYIEKSMKNRTTCGVYIHIYYSFFNDVHELGVLTPDTDD